MTFTELLPALDSVGFAFLRDLLAFLWQSSLFLAAIAIIALFLRKNRAAIRHRLWVGALLMLPLIPPLGGIYGLLNTPRAELIVFPAYTPQTTSLPAINSTPSAPSSFPSSAPAATIDRETHGPTFSDYPWAFFLVGYLAATFFSLFLLGLGWMRLRRCCHTGSVVTDSRTLALFGKAEEALGLSWRFRLVECAGLPAPLTLGFFHPIILLPPGLASSLPDDHLLAVAAHELAHMRRGDPLILTAVSLIRALFFFHPLVWYAARRVADLAEEACDDRVLETGCEPMEYAELLSRMAATLCTPPFTAELAAGFVFSRHAFLRRVEAVLSGKREHLRRLSRLALAGVLAVTILSLGIVLSLPLGEEKKVQKAALPGATANIQHIVSSTQVQKLVVTGRKSSTWIAYIQDLFSTDLFLRHMAAIGKPLPDVFRSYKIKSVYEADEKTGDTLYAVEIKPEKAACTVIILDSDGGFMQRFDNCPGFRELYTHEFAIRTNLPIITRLVVFYKNKPPERVKGGKEIWDAVLRNPYNINEFENYLSSIGRSLPESVNNTTISVRGVFRTDRKWIEPLYIFEMRSGFSDGFAVVLTGSGGFVQRIDRCAVLPELVFPDVDPRADIPMSRLTAGRRIIPLPDFNLDGYGDLPVCRGGGENQAWMVYFSGPDSLSLASTVRFVKPEPPDLHVRNYGNFTLHLLRGMNWPREMLLSNSGIMTSDPGNSGINRVKLKRYRMPFISPLKGNAPVQPHVQDKER